MAAHGLWPGQGAGYFHFAENDMMDGFQGTSFYQTNLIDWNGTAPTATQASIIPSTITFNQVNISNFGFGTNFTNRNSFHVYGQLWVPATSSTQGYIQNYFDGVPTKIYLELVQLGYRAAAYWAEYREHHRSGSHVHKPWR
jgi:hypothetical protein